VEGGKGEKIRFQKVTEDIYLFVGFEVLTPVVMESTIFWNITPCTPLKFNRRFGGTYRLHLYGRRISRVLLATNFHAGFSLRLFIDPEKGGEMFLRNAD
jgi:hypothetical protein